MEEKLRFREKSELVFARGIHRCNFKHPLLLDTVTSKAGLANRIKGGGRERKKLEEEEKRHRRNGLPAQSRPGQRVL